MITFKSLLPHALLGLSLSLAACADVPDVPDDEPAVSAASNPLLVSSWSGTALLPQGTFYGIQVATLNGVTYAVGAGHATIDHNTLYWYKLTPKGWSDNGPVPGQTSRAKVSLAAFNGYLYMVHNAGDGSSTTWLSRFDPATQQWTDNYQIPYTSFAGPPAIVAYNNLLYFIGTGPYPHPMWYATMTAGESFSTPIAIPGHDAASRPTAAVLFNKLYFAHRWGQTGDIVFGTFNGSTWTAATHIPGGNAGGTLRGTEMALAADNGVLHLVHQRPEGVNYVWWTYFDGCNWAGAEVTLGTQLSTLPPSLADGGPGLVMLTTSNDPNGQFSSKMVSRTYTHPFSPMPPQLPTCGIVIGPS